jgi:CRISPR system Cascade subunit CasB
MSNVDTLSFTQNETAREALLSWWRELKEARGDLAELRRALNPVEIAFCPAFHRLLHILRHVRKVSPNSLAVVAGVLAHVKEHDAGNSFPAQMASPKQPGGPARVSGLRFRRLLQIGDRDELFLPLIRTIRLTEGRVNILSLADSIYFWGERVRRDWAYAYYEQSPTEK